MTRLNLTETCLLEVSGELGSNARVQLREHVQRFPAAKLEYEIIKGQYDILTSIPKPAMSDVQKREISSRIKQGIHRKLRLKTQQEHSRNRWKLVYKAMAGISAIAACGVIAVTIFYLERSVAAQRQEARVAKIHEIIDVMKESQRDNDFGQSIRDIAAGIDQLQQNENSAIAGVRNLEMSQVLEALSNVTPADETPAPAPKLPSDSPSDSGG